MLKTWNEGINNIANTKGKKDEQSWRRLERMTIAVFETLLA